ncbi:hypothetical protein K461DRAFT_280127 [Myriangium duriaei CBS 260.36]|uniref:Transcription initiation factor IIF subunit beta n=1 Tax=Myriangium duriaei CBS 260.36 TaxID=1168546 RepID=A0A9P4J2R8_9PEZI|nr:hypothetical protein K461DRAFT_280127 [Myriangium duriaei CBS 260.36]
MTSPGIKMEEDVKIKPDPATATERSLIDEDEYEDTGELQIRGMDQAWLAKIPKWLWEAWTNIAEDDEIELGKVRVYHNNRPDGQQKLKIVLHDIPGHTDVPKKYDVNMNKDHYNNTVVFSEKDQPGFKGGQAWNRDKRMPQQQQPKDRNALGATNDGNRVSKKPYRSAIPKQTALAGFLQHEVTVTAVENAEYARITAARFHALSQPKRTTTITTGIDHAMHPGLASQRAGFAAFQRPAAGAKSAKKRAQTDKAVRVSEDALLDMLHGCFKEYRYWSLRALKQRLHQPEAFIKTVVEKIAVLQRSGTFTGNWKLRPEYEAVTTGVKEEAAVEEEDEDEDSVKDEDEDDFEDVKMEE